MEKKQKKKFGIIALIIAFILGVAFAVGLSFLLRINFAGPGAGPGQGGPEGGPGQQNMQPPQASISYFLK